MRQQILIAVSTLLVDVQCYDNHDNRDYFVHDNRFFTFFIIAQHYISYDKKPTKTASESKIETRVGLKYIQKYLSNLKGVLCGKNLFFCFLSENECLNGMELVHIFIFFS